MVGHHTEITIMMIIC